MARNMMSGTKGMRGPQQGLPTHPAVPQARADHVLGGLKGSAVAPAGANLTSGLGGGGTPMGTPSGC